MLKQCIILIVLTFLSDTILPPELLPLSALALVLIAEHRHKNGQFGGTDEFNRFIYCLIFLLHLHTFVLTIVSLHAGALIYLPYGLFMLAALSFGYNINKLSDARAFKRPHLIFAILPALAVLITLRVFVPDATVTGDPAFPLGEKINLSPAPPLTLTQLNSTTYTATDSTRTNLTIKINTTPDGRIIKTKHTLSFESQLSAQLHAQFAGDEAYKHYQASRGPGLYRHERYTGQRSLDIIDPDNGDSVSILFEDHRHHTTPAPAIKEEQIEQIHGRLNGIFSAPPAAATTP